MNAHEWHARQTETNQLNARAAQSRGFAKPVLGRRARHRPPETPLPKRIRWSAGGIAQPVECCIGNTTSWLRRIKRRRVVRRIVVRGLLRVETTAAVMYGGLAYMGCAALIGQFGHPYPMGTMHMHTWTSSRK